MHKNTMYSDKKSSSSKQVDTISEATSYSKGKRNKKISELRKELLVDGGVMVGEESGKKPRGKTRSRMVEV